MVTDTTSLWATLETVFVIMVAIASLVAVIVMVLGPVWTAVRGHAAKWRSRADIFDYPHVHHEDLGSRFDPV